MSLKAALKQLLKDGEELYAKVCKVVKVDGLNCEVEPVDGDANILDVRLVADESAKHLVIVPKVGSLVVIQFLNNAAAYVAMVSEIDEVLYKIDNAFYSVTKDGYLMKKDNDTLKKVLTNIVEAVEKIVVIQGNNPDYAKLSAAKISINNLLRDA